MLQRGIVLLALGCGLGLLFATFLQPSRARGEDAPKELLEEPAKPTQRAKDLSRPFVEATKQVRPAVVQILNYGRDFRGKLQQQSTGSGFFFSKDGHVLTNRHVVRNASQLAVKFLDGSTSGKVRVLGTDPRSDLAVLRVDTDEKFGVAQLGDSDKLEVGEWVIAIGAPFQLASSVSAGVVSARGRTGVISDPRFDEAEFSESFIQTDAALNPGNSGGPLINLDGQVIGINTAIETGNQIRANVGIGFAIPINMARTIAIALIERGVAKRGWLGVRVKAGRGPDFEKATGLDLPGGLIVEHVQADSPAAKAGLKTGDVITEIDATPMKDLKSLGARLARTGPGGAMSIAYYRGGKKTSTKATLSAEPLYTFGLVVEDLDERHAREMGLRTDVQAVVITQIEKGSPALRTAKHRLYPGDVIYRIDTRYGSFRIRNNQDFIRVMQMRPQALKVVIATKRGFYEFFLRQ
ncbi:MAG: trypsin-like peptidase domain-containing protein [Planctomycetota bacterium]|jgi:serine protease Do